MKPQQVDIERDPAEEILVPAGVTKPLWCLLTLPQPVFATVPFVVHVSALLIGFAYHQQLSLS